MHFSGSSSEKSLVRSGVPQGSILGPLLFLIYMNALCDVIDFSNIKLFADDSKLYFAFMNPADCNF